MTLTDDDVRAALDHRLAAAGLLDDDAIPAPRQADLRLAPVPDRSPRRRVLAVAAALVLLAGVAALVAARDEGTTRTQTATTTTASPTTTEPADDRAALPPPWPKLDVRPQTSLDLHGDPIDSEQEFSERLSELDAQTKTEAATGRMNVLDQLTGEVVNVDALGYNAQWFDVVHWYDEHIGMPDDGLMVGLDPAIVFTDGSYRLIYRSDLDCTPNADGHRPPPCLDREDVGLPSDAPGGG